jgi:hypothetical protein
MPKVVVPLQESDALLVVWSTVAGRDPFGLFIPLAVISQDDRSVVDCPVIGTLPDGRLVINAVEDDSFVREANLSDAPVPGAHSGIDRVLWEVGRAENERLSPWSVRWSRSPQNTT